MPLRSRALVAVLLAAAALSGCGGMGDGPFGTVEGGKPNDTDAAFVRAMIAHERAVGSIAEFGSRKTLRTELREIARARLTRHDRQVRELDWYTGSLRTRRVPPAGAELGKPPPYDPRGLRNAVSIDHEFLRLMIQHHEYAMAAAAAERDRGGDARVKLLAAKVHEASRQDLAKLKRWLRTWYGGDPQPGLPPAPSPGGGASPGPGV